MGTSVQVTPLSGAYGEGPLCYLLAVDGFRFLLDCGWTDLCETSQLQPLAKYASSYPRELSLSSSIKLPLEEVIDAADATLVHLFDEMSPRVRLEFGWRCVQIRW
jgi:hypothetical protein